MKAIIDFAARFGAKLSLNPDLMVKKEGRYFLLTRLLRRFILEDFYYAGAYLGKTKAGKFFPSFNLLRKMGENKANSVVVDRKASWLFICGRDIFHEGIKSVHGSRRKGDITLVMNDFGECLGFGRILQDLSSKGTCIAVKNISDIGDFLRRER